MNWNELYKNYKNFKEYNNDARFDIMQFVGHYSRYGVVGKLRIPIELYESDLSATELLLSIDGLNKYSASAFYYELAYQKASYEHLLSSVEYISQGDPNNDDAKELLNTMKDWFIKNVESVMSVLTRVYSTFDGKPLLTNLTIKNFTLDGNIIGWYSI